MKVNEVGQLAALFEGPETEHNWEGREKAVQKIRSIVKASDVAHAELVNAVKPLVEPLLGNLASLRTALVTATCAAIVDICEALKDGIDPMADTILRQLLKLLSQAKKIVSNAGSAAINALIQAASYQPRLLQHILASLTNKNVVVRNHSISFVKIIVTSVASSETSRHAFEKTGGLTAVDQSLRKAVQDASPVVRESSREILELLLPWWPQVVERLIASSDPTTRKVLSNILKKRAPGPLKSPPTQQESVAKTASQPLDAREAHTELEPEMTTKETSQKTTDDVPSGSSLIDEVRMLVSAGRTTQNTAMLDDVVKQIISSEESEEIQQLLELPEILSIMKDGSDTFTDSLIVRYLNLLVAQENLSNYSHTIDEYLLSLDEKSLLSKLVSYLNCSQKLFHKKGFKSVSECIIRWCYNAFVETGISKSNYTQTFFADMSHLQTFLNVFVTIYCAGSTHRERLLEILYRLEMLSPNTFNRKLSTFDFEISKEILDFLHKRAEANGINGKPTQQQDPDQTFEVASKEEASLDAPLLEEESMFIDGDSEMFNETLPDAFADVSQYQNILEDISEITQLDSIPMPQGTVTGVFSGSSGISNQSNGHKLETTPKGKKEAFNIQTESPRDVDLAQSIISMLRLKANPEEIEQKLIQTSVQLDQTPHIVSKLLTKDVVAGSSDLLLKSIVQSCSSQTDIDTFVTILISGLRASLQDEGMVPKSDFTELPGLCHAAFKYLTLAIKRQLRGLESKNVKTRQAAIVELILNEGTNMNRSELRKSNTNPKRPDAEALRNLDGSIKKNTAFIRKLKTITADQASALKKEILSLKLEKYISEIVSAILEAKLPKSADVYAAVEICSLLHQRFADFGPLLIDGLIKQVGPPPSWPGLTPEQKEREETARIARQKGVLRLLGELYVVGLVPRSNLKGDVIVTLLRDMFGSDKEFVNLPIATTFAKYLGDLFWGSTPEGDEASQEESNLLVSPDVKSAVQEIFNNYFGLVSKHLTRMHKHVRKMEAANVELQISRGGLPEDREKRFQKFVEMYEKFMANTQSLSQSLKKDMPDLPTLDNKDVVEVEIGQGARERTDQDSQSSSSLWEDEDARTFYENLIELKNFVPAVLLGSEVTELPAAVSDENVNVEVTENDEQKTSAEDVSVDAEADASFIAEIEEMNIDEDSNDEDEKLKEGTGASKAEFEALVGRMPSALSRDLIDQIAVQFCFLNSKPAKKRLVKHLFSVPRQRLELLPYYARLIATLYPYMPDVGQSVLEKLEKEFSIISRRKEKVPMEEKLKLDIIMRKKAVQHIDSRLSLLIENAFYQCNPPERGNQVVKERSPLELYIQKLIYSDLSESAAGHILRQFRKFDWTNPATVKLIKKPFFKPWKARYSHLPLLAFLASELARIYPDFGTAIVDNCLEEIRIGLETNIFKFNQRRIATIKFLGELYNYCLIESDTIFETLYFLLRFGYATPLPERGQFISLDAPHDFFRVRLCCALLEPCGQFFKHGSLAKRLDEFLAFLQVYVQTKGSMTMDIEFLLLETLESLRPSMKVVGDYDEALEQLNRLAVVNNKTGLAQNGDEAELQRDRDEGGMVGSRDNDEEDESPEKDFDVRSQGSQPEDDDEESDSADDDKDSQDLDDQEDDDIVVRLLDDGDRAEEDMAFEEEFSKMMQESMDHRKHERKVQNFDAPIPAKSKGPLNNTESETDKDRVVFSLLTKKGNKQQVKNMLLPKDSSFVLNTRLKQEAEQEEKMQLKRLVLNYEQRAREEALEEFNKPPPKQLFSNALRIRQDRREK
ncbi:hypothetical protein HDV05_006225 [Chytridiales sp. JEL 0842]|nr:hypothetical protein HDV05_006225 [Chytridiales sp. JEL 0842]